LSTRDFLAKIFGMTICAVILAWAVSVLIHGPERASSEGRELVGQIIIYLLGMLSGLFIPKK
jgi:hypothetical protein